MVHKKYLSLGDQKYCLVNFKKIVQVICNSQLICSLCSTYVVVLVWSIFFQVSYSIQAINVVGLVIKFIVHKKYIRWQNKFIGWKNKDWWVSFKNCTKNNIQFSIYLFIVPYLCCKSGLTYSFPKLVIQCKE